LIANASRLYIKYDRKNIPDFAGEKGITKIQHNKEGMKLLGTYLLLVYAEDFNLLGDNTGTIKKTPLQWLPDGGLSKSNF
jgi:hypothetical protein